MEPAALAKCWAAELREVVAGTSDREKLWCAQCVGCVTRQWSDEAPGAIISGLPHLRAGRRAQSSLLSSAGHRRLISLRIYALLPTCLELRCRLLCPRSVIVKYAAHLPQRVRGSGTAVPLALRCLFFSNTGRRQGLDEWRASIFRHRVRQSLFLSVPTKQNCHSGSHRAMGLKVSDATVLCRIYWSPKR